ncbi:hypothetical protein HN371_24865 [Candidatus Poribacteria bacterium]|nr:hypothetical protein [Candidatus Poribacteria bacterium]MBT7099710.1 hypothetical protein [Candidatus Poribacteria bacterium]MBT7809632.1 hypothetical protein [Candidatus Poribacteria bacterium]
MEVKTVDFYTYKTDDMPKSIGFYRDMFGLTPALVLEHGGEQYWAEYEVGGATIAVHLPHVGPSAGAVALAVGDVRAAVEELKAKGTQVVFGPMDSSVCWIATVLDPDGNPIILHQRHDGTCG